MRTSGAPFYIPYGYVSRHSLKGQFYLPTPDDVGKEIRWTLARHFTLGRKNGIRLYGESSLQGTGRWGKARREEVWELVLNTFIDVDTVAKVTPWVC